MNIGQSLSLFIFIILIIDQMKFSYTYELLGENKKECSSLLEDFAVASADFMLCSISNARPIHMCLSCVGSYNAVMQGHINLMQMAESSNTSCKEKLTNLDRLEIIEAGYSYVNNLWLQGQCRSCFVEDINDSLPFEVSNRTKEFQRLYLDTQMCLSKFYNVSSETYDIAVCTNCSEIYCKMNENYNQIKANLGDGHVCMDVVDTMNTTQNFWSDVLHCGGTVMTPEVPLIVTCTLILALPVVFYILVRVCNTTKPSTISIQKRLSQRLTQKWRSRTGSMISQFRF